MTGPTVAILPVKLLSSAKQRLAAELSDGVRGQLMTAMLADVAAALRATAAIDLTLLVTRDPQIGSLASRLGLELLAEPADCDTHSAAAKFAAAWAAHHGARRVVCCAADCPLADPHELDLLLKRCDDEQIGFAVVPDRAGTGTNALAITPPTACSPAFGPDSKERHIALAESRGIAAEVISVLSLGFDLDTGQDLDDLRQMLSSNPDAAPVTAAALRDLAVLQ